MAMKGFLSQFDVTIDDKGRVRIPAKFKAQLGEDFVIACGSSACLKIYPMDKWEKLTAQVDQLSEFDEDAEQFKRTLYTNASFGEFDAAGRVLIPKRYRAYAELKKDLIASGVGDHFELWDAENWQKGDYASLAKRRDLQKGIAAKLSGDKA
ncbi:MAG: division/cell wall cluster transcriptional repressor MraZ [Clostridia bacterium]|nr:division/cell wall cluster transcriptional repressor MraZ [Clostridia bacterium]